MSGAAERLDVYGPPGAERMLCAFFDYMQIDIETRIADEERADVLMEV